MKGRSRRRSLITGGGWLIVTLLAGACAKQPSSRGTRSEVQGNPALPSQRLPEAPGSAGLVSIDPNGGPSLKVTSHGIVVDDKLVVLLTNGAVNPGELEAPAMPLIRRLRDVLSTTARGMHSSSLMIAIEPELSYRLLLEIMFSAARAGIRSPILIVAVGDELKGIPVRLPRSTASLHDGVHLVVTISKDQMSLWSLSGEEGAIDNPKIRTNAPVEIQKTLMEIKNRRWGTGPRHQAEREIIVMADDHVPVQRIVDVLAVARVTPDGDELFPDPLLTSNFK